MSISVKELLKLQERNDTMQSNLWGDPEYLDIQRMPRRTPETAYTPVHCEFYGHTWVYSGISGQKGL